MDAKVISIGCRMTDRIKVHRKRTLFVIFARVANTVFASGNWPAKRKRLCWRITGAQKITRVAWFVGCLGSFGR
jgi:hypothetical protein